MGDPSGVPAGGPGAPFDRVIVTPGTPSWMGPARLAVGLRLVYKFPLPCRT